jgi:hypothetical protein
MSVNPNSTNASRTTSYFLTKDSNNNLEIGSLQLTPATQDATDSDSIYSGFNPYNGYNCVAVFNSANGNLGPLQAGGNISVQQAGNSPSSALYRMFYTSDGITWEQANTGTAFPMVTINPTNQTQNLLNLSTINAGTNTANAVALMSSLKGTFPTSFQ